MFVYARNSSFFYRTGLGLALCLAGAVPAWAQSTDLPAAPTPNPSSLSNPYFGSVTATSATDEVLKLSLDDSIARGLRQNLGLKEAEMGERTLHGEKLEALQEFLPTITISGGPSVHEYNLAALGFGPGLLKKISGVFPPGSFGDVSFITKADVTTGQLNYEQTLFSGPVISGFAAISAAQKVAYFSKMSARGEVVQRVGTAYLAVIADQSQVDNANSLLEADRVLLDQAHQKHEAGTVANLDELRARVQYQQQQQNLVADENKRRKDEILLKREIGVAPEQKIQLTDPAPYSDIAAKTPEEIREVAYANRQDYQNLQSQQVENRKLIEARHLQRLPVLSFKGNYGVTGVTGEGYHGTFSAVGTLKFPIFREAGQHGEVDVAKAQDQAGTIQLDDLRSKIDQQVRSALLDVQAAKQLVEVSQSSVDLAKSTLSDESDRFAAGIDDTLPLVQAQSSLATAQSTLVESLYQYNVSKLNLARSAGVVELQYRAYLGR
jgi:outer membrane protein TolC